MSYDHEEATKNYLVSMSLLRNARLSGDPQGKGAIMVSSSIFFLPCALKSPGLI